MRLQTRCLPVLLVLAALPASLRAQQRHALDPAPLRVLWARRWVADLMDQLAVLRRSQPIEGAITQLGLTYNLLTRFTSFVAVDRVIANRSGHGVQARSAAHHSGELSTP